MPVIEFTTEIHQKKVIVFDLARSIELHKISTEHTNEEAVAGKTFGLLELNETVTWRAKHFGIYQQLTSKMTEVQFPDLFIDEMEKGIFKRFWHKHTFLEKDNITTMTDIFDYDAPLGIMGKLADWLFLKNYMKKLLEKRNATIKEYAESDQWKKILSFKDE